MNAIRNLSETIFVNFFIGIANCLKLFFMLLLSLACWFMLMACAHCILIYKNANQAKSFFPCHECRSWLKHSIQMSCATEYTGFAILNILNTSDKSCFTVCLNWMLHSYHFFFWYGTNMCHFTWSTRKETKSIITIYLQNSNLQISTKNMRKLPSYSIIVWRLFQ